MLSFVSLEWKAGPDSTLLTENYGYLPLMQSSKEDRECAPFFDESPHSGLIMGDKYRETRIHGFAGYHGRHDWRGNHRASTD